MCPPLFVRTYIHLDSVPINIGTLLPFPITLFGRFTACHEKIFTMAHLEVPLGTTVRRFNVMEPEHIAKFAPKLLLPSPGRVVDHVLVENTHFGIS